MVTFMERIFYEENYFVLILLLIGLDKSICSQVLPLLENNKIWNVCEVFAENPTQHLTLSLGDDTTIGNYTYKEVIDSLSWSTGIYTVGWIREDSLNKVYFLQGHNSYPAVYCFSDTVESLLYDFRLQIGDTIYYANRWNIINGIDSITVKGVVRKDGVFHTSVSDAIWVAILLLKV